MSSRRELISLTDLSPFVDPPGGTLMGILKAYVDDSGDDRDAQHSVVSIACYLSHADQWRVFEREWREVLEGYEVPYLHMKEFWNRDKDTYRHLKEDQNRQKNFFADLVQVVGDNINYCFSAVVRIEDIKKFNREFSVELDTFSFALYAAVVSLREIYVSEDIHIVIDKITKPQKRIDLAKQYIRTDTFKDLNSDCLTITPLEKDESFVDVLPIQASDFMAWELRKAYEDRKEWEPTEESRLSKGALKEHYDEWAQSFLKQHGRLPRQRLSAFGLEKATPQKGHLWDFVNIRAAHLVRHKNGWVD
jgi:hypothetical protein